MIQTLKQIKTRIHAIEETQKVTNVMQMVSVAKLNRVHKALLALRPYFLRLEGVLSHLVHSQNSVGHAYFRETPQRDRLLLCVVASDTGLCGLYNYNVLRQAENFIQKEGKEKVSLILIGKKAVNHFKNKGITILHSYSGFHGAYNTLMSDEIAGVLSHLFLAQRFDAVFIAYANFKTAVIQDAVVEKFFPIRLQEGDKTEFILEQDFEALLAKIALKYVITRLRLILLQAFTSEHAARSMAMKAATDNAGELLGDLNLTKNKIRQANITQDMLEIVSSAEALKG